MLDVSGHDIEVTGDAARFDLDPGCDDGLGQIRLSQAARSVPVTAGSPMDGQIRKWATISAAAMSKETISALYRPEGAYRISEFTYEAGVKFPGAMREGTCYVLAGACKFTFDRDVWIRAGEFATLPGGGYHMEVTSDEPVTLVLVWLLPREFWKTNSP